MSYFWIEVFVFDEFFFDIFDKYSDDGCVRVVFWKFQQVIEGFVDFFRVEFRVFCYGGDLLNGESCQCKWIYYMKDRFILMWVNLFLLSKLWMFFGVMWCILNVIV